MLVPLGMEPALLSAKQAGRARAGEKVTHNRHAGWRRFGGAGYFVQFLYIILIKYSVVFNHKLINY